MTERMKSINDTAKAMRRYIKEYEDKEHKTQKIKVGEEIVDVDIKMVPYVNWLNAIGARTLFCCQGWKDTSLINHCPYVTFRCDNLNVLAKILSSLKHDIDEDTMLIFGRCEVDVYQGQMRYYIRFDSIYHFAKCKKMLGL
jgi:hypothetical protein